MSDQSLAAAVLVHAVMSKTELPPGTDVDREALRLYRRYTALMARIAERRKEGAADVEDGPTSPVSAGS